MTVGSGDLFILEKNLPLSILYLDFHFNQLEIMFYSTYSTHIGYSDTVHLVF